MNRLFSVSLKRLHPDRCFPSKNERNFEVIAPEAKRAIDKATAQARREIREYRGTWIVTELKHRGPAI